MLLKRLVLLVVGVGVLLLAAPVQPASAHPLSTTAVLLDLGSNQVTATVELPLDELSVAMGEDLTPAGVVEEATLAGLRTYVQQDLAVTDDADRTWTTTVTGGRVAQVEG